MSEVRVFEYLREELIPFLHGQQSVSGSGSGVRPSRLGETALRRVPSVAMRAVVDAAAGVRLRFRTSASQVRLTGTFWLLEIGEVRWPPPMIDVVTADAVSSHSVQSSARAVFDGQVDLVHHRAGEVTTLTFQLDARRDQVVEVWLPQSVVCDLVALSADHPLEAATDQRPRWVHHGSSISRFLEASSPTRTWPAIVSREHGLNLQNLGFAGSATVDAFVARQTRDMPADVVSLKLGINIVNADVMHMRAFVPAVEGFLDTVRDGHPDIPLVLASPIVCPAVEARPGPTGADELGVCLSLAGPDASPDAATLERIRAALANVVERLSEDIHLTYVDGSALLGQDEVADGLLSDGLHPDSAGYAVIAANFGRALQNAGIVS